MPRCFPARRRIGLKRRRQLSVMLLAVLPVIAATSPPPDSVFDTGLGAAQVASDSELADMRGKFISAENVRFFGITLHTLWQSDDGVVTAARLGFSIWLGENGASGPQVVVQWQREGDPDMDVAGFAPGADGAYVVAPTTGAFQSNVIAGSDNQTANRMSVAVVPASSVATGSSGGTFTGTATGTALDGDTITFIAEDGQFGLAMVDAQGGGTVRQGISSDPGQLSQSILLNSDRNAVVNSMNVTVGIDRGQMTDTVNIANSLSAMKGHGF